MVKPYDLTTYDGNRVDWLTRKALEATADRLGYDLTITQGSYNAGGVSASAGTHDGGGVVDLAPWDHGRKVRELRRTGFAAWYRTPDQGPWPPHIHAVLIGNAKLAPSAARQVTAYFRGRNGLANNGPDTHTREFTDRRFHWPVPTRVQRAQALMRRAALLLRDAATVGKRTDIAEGRSALYRARKRTPKN